MNALFLVWYACGWAALAIWALRQRRVRWADLICCLYGGPWVFLVLTILALIESEALGRVLWENRDSALNPAGRRGATVPGRSAVRGDEPIS